MTGDTQERCRFVGTVVLLLTVVATPALGTDYCTDPERTARWEQLSRRHPADTEVQILDALRLGLCQKVAAGTLTEQELVRIFGSARAALLGDEASQRLREFLDREADRRRRETSRDARLRRLEDEYIGYSEEVAEIGVEIRALQRALERDRERYRRRCGDDGRDDRNCQRLRDELREQRRELEKLRDQEDRARRRALGALERMEEARQAAQFQ